MSLPQHTSVACIGGAHWDQKICLQQPAEMGTSNPARTTRSHGGVARNVAENLARLGCYVSLFSVLGDDVPARDLIAAMTELGVNCDDLLCAPDRTTANYSAVLNPDGALVIGIADMEIYCDLDAAWADATVPKLADHGVWVLDGNINAAGLSRLLRHPDRPAIVLVDPVSVAKSARLLPTLDRIDVLFPDRAEAAALSGLPVRNGEQALAAADHLCSVGVGSVVVSLGAAGIAMTDGSYRALLPAAPVGIVRDVTGAGDALLAGYVYGLIHGGEIPPELFGLAAAGLTIEVAATVNPDLTPERLQQRVADLADHGAS